MAPGWAARPIYADDPNLYLIYKRMAQDCANVHLSPDMYLNVPNTPGSLEYVRAANFYLRDRLLFGTAYPSRPMVESVEQFHRLP